MKSTARDLATLLHTAESLRDHGLPTEPVNSHPPWYHCNSQVHKTFFFFFTSEFTIFKKPFPVTLDQKEAAWGVFQFQILCDSPVWCVSFTRKLGGRQCLSPRGRGTAGGSVPVGEPEGSRQAGEGPFVLGSQFS